MAEYKYNPLDGQWEWYFTDDEIEARVAAYLAQKTAQTTAA